MKFWVKCIQNSSINFKNFKKFRFFGQKSFINWYYLVYILLRISCWFRDFFMFTSIYWEILILKVCPKFQKCRILGNIRHGYGIFWYQSIGSGQGYSGSALGRYVRVCAGRCLLCRYGAGTVPAPSTCRSVLLRAGTGPVILYIYSKVPFGAGFAERSQVLLILFY